MAEFEDINLSETEFNNLIEQANQIYIENQPKEVGFGKCIFLSYYCSLNDCDFCYRSTTTKEDSDPKKMRRGIPSMLTEAILTKVFGWEVEFLTGGYGIFSYDEMAKILKFVSIIMEKPIWINLGAMGKIQLEKFKPYVEGVVCSLESIDDELRKKVCPSKPISAYENLYKIANELDGMKKSMTMVIGIGEKPEHLQQMFDFIDKHKLDRITFYALNPIRGTPYEKGPDPRYYAWWIAQTRLRYPKMHIIAGTGNDRTSEAELLYLAGANTITKFSAVKHFGTKAALNIEHAAKSAGRIFKGTMSEIPKIDWNKYIDDINFEIDAEEELILKEKLKLKLGDYLSRMNKKKIPILA